MSNRWQNELFKFIGQKTYLPKSRIEHILHIYTPEVFPESLHEVLQDMLTEKKVTKEGVSPLTQYGALSTLIDLEAEQTEKEVIRLEAIMQQGKIPDPVLDEVPELFLGYLNITEKICSETGENEETIHQVHRAYLEFIFMKTNNPDTLVPFLKWYLKNENIKHHC